ncbi:MAG TPA: hypothetical protein DEO56_07925 [Nitrosomonas nitrosa]|nr:hypothetical protein [Nitrosomonas nitrosa]
MSNEEDKETPVQAKLASVQREISPEEDKGILVQTKLATEISRKFLQRQLEPIEEEEEPIQAKSAGSMSDSFEAGDDVESQINQSKGLGSPLPDPVRSYMEPRFGVDFSGVRVHTGNDAVQMNRNVGAQAFTHGSDIYFGEGRSPSNLELTAHELTHAVQQSNASVLSKERIQKRGESGGSSSEGESSETTEERLDEIERIYRAMIAKARSDGYDVAADNLERFLAGTGGTSILEVGWLRGFDDVIDAERTNQSRFESSLSDRAAELADGSSRSFNDHWDRRLTASVLDELYYASGTSTITSTGSFTLSRSGNEVSITGSVNHRWWDPYDWHAGLSAYIPGFGSISDSDALLLKEHRGAASFDMESTWEQSVQGTVTVRDYWFDSSSYDWSEP